jgi:hypothetical protein
VSALGRWGIRGGTCGAGLHPPQVFTLAPASATMLEGVADQTPTDLTLKQASERTGRSTHALRRAIKAGLIDATRDDGGRYLIDLATLTASNLDQPPKASPPLSPLRRSPP